MGLLTSSVANADLLSNGNLDTTSVGPQTLATPTGWSVTAFRRVSGAFTDGCSSEGFANIAALGGSGLFFKPFQGSSSDPLTVNFYQDKPASAGLTYTFTGWAGAEPNYSGLIANSMTKSVFSIDFLNAANSVIGSATLDLRSGLGTPSANPFNYKQYSLTATAPAGTATIRVGASMVDAYANPVGGGQAFVVDAFALEVPEPSVLGLIALGLTGLGICWRSKPRTADPQANPNLCS